MHSLLLKRWVCYLCSSNQESIDCSNTAWIGASVITFETKQVNALEINMNWEAGARWFRKAENPPKICYAYCNFTNFQSKFWKIHINSISGHCIHFTLKTCRLKVLPVNFTNFFDLYFWQVFPIQPNCMLVAGGSWPALKPSTKVRYRFSFMEALGLDFSK